MVPNQGLQGIAFFEATACLTLLVLFIHLQKDNPACFLSVFGCSGGFRLTVSSPANWSSISAHVRVLHILVGARARPLLFSSSLPSSSLFWPDIATIGPLWLAVLLALTAGYTGKSSSGLEETRWETAILQSAICLAAGWLLWRSRTAHPGHGTKLLAGSFTLLALNNLDRPGWTHGEIHLLRFAFDHFLNASLGIGMIVLLLENARTRSEEISEKMRQFTHVDRIQQPVRVTCGSFCKKS